MNLRPAATAPQRSKDRSAHGGGPGYEGDDPIELSAIRAELPVLQRTAYMNAGSHGPVPRRAFDAQLAVLTRELAEGRGNHGYWDEVHVARAELRAQLASLLNAPETSIAITTSTTEACNIVVRGLGLAPEDEIVTTDVEHSGLLGSLELSPATVRFARVRQRPAARALQAIEDEITDRTRLIAVSHVAWTTGVVLPVRELAGRGIPLLVDGAQAAGAIPVDLEALDADFYALSAQKWLLGPSLMGALYVRPERVGTLAMSAAGPMSWEGMDPFRAWPDARRFEGIAVRGAAVAGLGASLAFAEEVGEQRFEHARAMAEYARKRIASKADVVTEPDQATIVSFAPRKVPPEEVVRRLAEQG